MYPLWSKYLFVCLFYRGSICYFVFIFVFYCLFSIFVCLFVSLFACLLVWVFVNTLHTFLPDWKIICCNCFELSGIMESMMESTLALWNKPFDLWRKQSACFLILNLCLVIKVCAFILIHKLLLWLISVIAKKSCTTKWVISVSLQLYPNWK